MSIQDKTGCPSLNFLNAEDVLAAVGVQYCTCIFSEGTHHSLIGELLDFGSGSF